MHQTHSVLQPIPQKAKSYITDTNTLKSINPKKKNKKTKAEERQFKNLTDMHRLCPKYCHISEGSDAIIPYYIYLLNSFWVCVHTCALFLNTRI